MIVASHLPARFGFAADTFEQSARKTNTFLLLLLALLSLTAIECFSATLPPGFSEETIAGPWEAWGGSWNFRRTAGCS